MGRRIVITYFIIIMDFAAHQNVGSQQYLANDFSGGLPNPYDDYHFGHFRRSVESCHHFVLYIHLFRQPFYY